MERLRREPDAKRGQGQKCEKTTQKTRLRRNKEIINTELSNKNDLEIKKQGKKADLDVEGEVEGALLEGHQLASEGARSLGRDRD
jgi:hypothetical protein